MFLNPNIKINREKLQQFISGIQGCIGCGRPISYKKSHSHFCLECCRKYPQKVREFNQQMKLKKKGGKPYWEILK